jgi:hypothetical protein
MRRTVTYPLTAEVLPILLSEPRVLGLQSLTAAAFALAELAASLCLGELSKCLFVLSQLLLVRGTRRARSTRIRLPPGVFTSSIAFSVPIGSSNALN